VVVELPWGFVVVISFSFSLAMTRVDVVDFKSTIVVVCDPDNLASIVSAPVLVIVVEDDAAESGDLEVRDWVVCVFGNLATIVSTPALPVVAEDDVAECRDLVLVVTGSGSTPLASLAVDVEVKGEAV
jgi:hypothetical protein